MSILNTVLLPFTFDRFALAADETIANDLAEMRKLVRSSPGPDPCAVPGLLSILAHPPSVVFTEVSKFAKVVKQQHQIGHKIARAGLRPTECAHQRGWEKERNAYGDAGGFESEERAHIVAEMSMAEKLDVAKKARAAKAAELAAARKNKAAAAAAARKEAALKRKAAATAAAAATPGKEHTRKRKAEVLTEDAEPVTGNRKSARVKAPTKRGMEASQVTPAALKTAAGKDKSKGKTTITRLRVTPPAPEQTKPKVMLKWTRGTSQKQPDDSTSTNNLPSSPPPDVRMSVDFMLSSATPGGSTSNKLLPPLAASDGSMSNNIVQSALPRDLNVSTDLTSGSIDGTLQPSLSAGAPAARHRKTSKKSAVGAGASNTQPPPPSSSGDHVAFTRPAGGPSDTTKSLRHTIASSKSTTDTSYTSTLSMPRQETEADYTSSKPRTHQPARASNPAPLPFTSVSAPQLSATNNGRTAHGHGHTLKLKRSTSANASAAGTSIFTSSLSSAATPAKKRTIDAIESIEDGEDSLPLSKTKKREQTPYPTSAERKRAEVDESSDNESFEDEQESDEDFAVNDSPVRKKTKRTSSDKTGPIAKTLVKQPKGTNNKVAKKAPTYKLPKDYVGVKSGHGHSTVPPPNADLKIGEQWRCGNLDCDSGMTWYDDDEYRRKSISNFFGRNKTATKRIADAVWHILCRRCYQDGYTPHTKKPEYLMNLAVNLTKLIRQQLERIKLWRPDATFSFDLHKTAKDRMHKWTALLATHGDKATALKLMPPVTVSKSQNKPIVEEMFPSQYAVDFMAKFVDNSKKDCSFDDVEKMLQWSLERVGEKKSPCITPFEILLNAPVEDETINDTSDNFKQWEDLQVAKQDAAKGQ
ncbi:hypothetical protein LTR95_009506 [Oleoguttula sp. CCFEE 5521]